MSTIGILDWGIGGIGVLRAIREARPDVDVVYLSDSGATPYGKLPRAALGARVAHAIAHLCAHGATHVVIGCHAASTVLDDIHADVPTTGMIAPTIRALSRVRGVIGVVGGARTIRSGLYRRALARDDVEIRQRVAQPLSAHIEAGTTRSPACDAALTRITRPLVGAHALVLACTHYPALRDRFEALLPGTRIIDPAAYVTKSALSSFCDARGRAATRAFTTGDPVAMTHAAARAFGVRLEEVRTASLP